MTCVTFSAVNNWIHVFEALNVVLVYRFARREIETLHCKIFSNYLHSVALLDLLCSSRQRELGNIASTKVLAHEVHVPVHEKYFCFKINMTIFIVFSCLDQYLLIKSFDIHLENYVLGNLMCL